MSILESPERGKTESYHPFLNQLSIVVRCLIFLRYSPCLCLSAFIANSNTKFIFYMMTRGKITHTRWNNRSMNEIWLKMKLIFVQNILLCCTISGWSLLLLLFFFRHDLSSLLLLCVCAAIIIWFVVTILILFVLLFWRVSSSSRKEL